MPARAILVRARLALALVLTGLAVLASRTAAQEALPASASASAPASRPEPDPPAAALRDLLSAACSQNESAFAQFLTPRNARAFRRLTGAARVALMKRLVLLDDPGKPSATTNASGRPSVRCETPLLTTEMQIGGSDLQDSLAFLPLEIRNVSDAAGANARQIQVGLVRDASGWKLLSLGLLLLDLPALEIEWNRASMDSSEHEAIETLRRLAGAIETYRRTFTKLPGNLAKLGPPTKGGATSDAAGLIDAELAAGARSGYIFRYVIAGASTVGAPAKYELAAAPRTYGTTGRRSFLLDTSGVLHGADHQGAFAAESDPRVE